MGERGREGGRERGGIKCGRTGREGGGGEGGGVAVERREVTVKREGSCERKLEKTRIAARYWKEG